MGIEFEMKYSATPEQQAAVLAAYPVTSREIRMETTYYDTPSGALSQRHITLRRRLENGTAVCTVKTPISGYGRGEWECAGEDIHTAVAELVRLGAPEEVAELVREGLVEVCGARFTRLAGDLAWGGTVLELALDRGILIGGGVEQPLCEIEVELKSGTPEDAVSLGMLLQKQFGLQPQKKSKFRRALALAKGE